MHMNLSDIPFLIHRVKYDVGPPFAAITASTLLGKLSTRFRSDFMGFLGHYSRSAFVRSDTDVWQKAWLAVSALIHPKGVLSGLGQDSVQVSQVLPHQTRSSMSLWTLLCALGHSHVGIERGHPQTVSTKMGAWNCPKSLGMLKHLEFLSLGLRGQAQLLKNNPTP